MKKILIALMIVSLALVSLVGCSSSEDASQKTEEELRAEVQAELEAERAAEAEARAELEAQIRAELDAEQKKEEPAPQQPAQSAHTPSTVYQLKQLSKGDRVGPFIVESSNVTNDEYGVVFSGVVTLSAKIIEDEMSGGVAFSRTDSENTIMIDFGNGVTKDVLGGGGFADGHHPGLSESTKFTIEGFMIGGNYYYGETNVIYKGPTASSSNNQGSTGSNQGKLSGYTAETINGTHINFSDYYAVIVPRYEGGVNSLELVTVYTGSVTQGTWEYPANFGLFGTLEDVKVIYYEGYGSSGHTFELGNYNDVNLNVHLFWNDSPNDMSFMRITGKVPTGGGNYKNVDFTLDQMRDADAYDLILVR
ncbi:hypothetical protein [Desulfuribacillus alkaliarsenatis]|uniref:Uncharacterized protein n=1 Tax=Desulfuribacillus alkaliarsenatis TaxID=766136 RepID=A0A1E5G1X7_9FIRM|nr:hypothetical protein [Desulfuribacillus alkaliarsenatis]OEF96985.1 hypothetical protein BHF68_05110 [Desulfuribacillus alkaliarsenatis]